MSLNKQIIDMQSHLYTHMQWQILHVAEKNLELDNIQLFVLNFEVNSYTFEGIAVYLSDVDHNL